MLICWQRASPLIPQCVELKKPRLRIAGENIASVTRSKKSKNFFVYCAIAPDMVDVHDFWQETRGQNPPRQILHDLPGFCDVLWQRVVRFCATEFAAGAQEKESVGKVFPMKANASNAKVEQ